MINEDDRLGNFNRRFYENGVTKINEEFRAKVNTKKLKSRVALIISEGKAFQQASVIVMRANFPKGYILKESFEVLDVAGKCINVKLPGAEGDLNLGKVALKPKYPTQMVMKARKLDGFKKNRLALGHAGDWIDALVEMQVRAKEYNDDTGDLSVFPQESLGSDNSLDCGNTTRVPSEY